MTEKTLPIILGGTLLAVLFWRRIVLFFIWLVMQAILLRISLTKKGGLVNHDPRRNSSSCRSCLCCYHYGLRNLYNHYC